LDRFAWKPTIFPPQKKEKKKRKEKNSLFFFFLTRKLTLQKFAHPLPLAKLRHGMGRGRPQFKPSCYASRQSPFFVRRGILRFNQPFSVQIDPNAIPAGHPEASVPPTLC
jgi:hypothetical protein